MTEKEFWARKALTREESFGKRDHVVIKMPVDGHEVRFYDGALGWTRDYPAAARMGRRRAFEVLESLSRGCLLLAVSGYGTEDEQVVKTARR